MIGVFDSWLGGVQTLRYLVDALPRYSYCYLWDTAGLPYGTKDPQRIQDRTFACCKRLFDQGCELVILACNSASTYAIRARQERYPDRKVLSVTVPGVEAVVEQWIHTVGVLGTQATIGSNLYPTFFARHFPDYIVTIEQVVGGDLVTLIEQGASHELIDEECEKIMKKFSKDLEAIILGCTHYPIISSEIKKNLPKGVVCINPAKEAVDKLSLYLQRHPEIANNLDQKGEIHFNITKDLASFHTVGSTIWWEPFTAKLVTVQE